WPTDAAAPDPTRSPRTTSDGRTSGSVRITGLGGSGRRDCCLKLVQSVRSFGRQALAVARVVAAARQPQSALRPAFDAFVLDIHDLALRLCADGFRIVNRRRTAAIQYRSAVDVLATTRARLFVRHLSVWQRPAGTPHQC